MGAGSITGEIHGDVLQENRTMLKLCEVFGFKKTRSPDELDIVRVTLRLGSDVENA